VSNQGLYRKYIVSKVDGSPVDAAADYFVMRLDTDKTARLAARLYAHYVKDSNPELAKDLRDRCDKYTPPQAEG